MDDFVPTYMRHIPNVNGVCATVSKPADFIIRMNSAGAGKRSTDAGRIFSKDHQFAFGPEDPEHLLESDVQVFEVTHSETDGDPVKGIIFVWQGFAVSNLSYCLFSPPLVNI